MQLGVGVQHDIGFQHDLHVDPGGGRVDDRDPLEHPVLGHPPGQQAAHLGQLHPVVDAEGLVPVLDQVRAHGQAVRDGEAEHVGQVLLALRVRAPDPAERLPQHLGVEGEHPGVDLGDLGLRGVGVPLLDDRHDRAVLAHDPAVAARVGHDGAEHGHRPPGALVRGHQVAQGAGGQQRGVAGDDEHGAVELVLGGQGLDRHARGVPGAVLLLLDHGPHGRVHRGEVRGHLLAPVPDHHGQLPRLELPGRLHHVADQRASAQLVQDLGGGGLHPGAPAGGEDDDRGGSDLSGHVNCLRVDEGFVAEPTGWPSTHGDLAAPGGGFEPPYSEPKSDVLPLDDPGSRRSSGARRNGVHDAVSAHLAANALPHADRTASYSSQPHQNAAAMRM